MTSSIIRVSLKSLRFLKILCFICEPVTTIVLVISEIVQVFELRTLLNKDNNVDGLIRQIAEQSLKVVVARAKAPPDTGFRFSK